MAFVKTFEAVEFITGATFLTQESLDKVFRLIWILLKTKHVNEIIRIVDHFLLGFTHIADKNARALLLHFIFDIFLVFRNFLLILHHQFYRVFIDILLWLDLLVVEV